MEPAAPGTEDEPVCIQEFRPSKKDAAEEEALSKKAFLPNGTYGNIFLLEYVQGAQHWFCRVCERPVFGRIFNHEIGKRHLSRLKLGRNDDVTDGDGDDDTKAAGSGMAVVVAPGEPLPPGFEGEMEMKTLIQDRLDKFNVGPLVGLEYLLELLDYDPSKEPQYMCLLCHKKGDPRTILTHLASYNHQVMYLQKHFPTAYRHIAPYMIKVYKRNWQAGLQKIAEAIETTFGRLKPIQVDANKFNKDNMHYIGIVAKGKHFSELSGHTFENVVTKEELTKVHEEPSKWTKAAAPTPVVQKRKSPSPPVVAKPVKRAKPVEIKPKKRSLSPVSDVSSSDLEEYDPRTSKKSNKANENFKKGNPTYNNNPIGRREGHMPWQKSTYRRDRPPPVTERKKDEKVEKMEEYKRLAKAIDNQMEQVLKKNKENPEKHPKYNDEWKKFWNTRYKELQAEGKNAAAHDFKPEWIEFWNKRMLELHQEEIKTSKMALRKRLGLPEEPTPISFKIGERRKPLETSKGPTPTAAQPDNDPEVIIIDDNDDDDIVARSKFQNPPSSKPPIRRVDNSSQFRRRSPPKTRNSSPPPPSRNLSPPSTRRKKSPSPFRRQSPPSRHRESPPSRHRESPPSRHRESPPSRHREPSPPRHRISPSYQRRKESPPSRRRDLPYSSYRDTRDSPPRIKDSPKRQLSPLSRRKSSPSALRAPSPPTRRATEEKIRSTSPVRDRSPPRRDKYERSREISEERPRSRGSREISWEKERERRREYDEMHWESRGYRPREVPWERELYPKDPYAPPKVLRDVTRKPVGLPEGPEEDDGEVNIVAVLRLLTALEEKLGSLGPKVIDLLAQALAMEKKVANSSEELLDSEMNCVLFETVKEKLKGQLQAGLVDWIQEKAFKTAVKKTASLIHIASQRKKQQEEELPKKPVVVPGVGKVDKGKIARQIANALIAQGKTDVTQNELEELINAVVGIAEAQKNSSETLTTASFLEKLSKAQTFEQPDTPKPDVPKEEPKELKQEKEKETEPIPTLEEDPEASNSSQDKSTINMEGLSDSDLETLLQNFKDLSGDEQHGLINYLKKLEAKEPERVEKLRKFVNLAENPEENSESGRYSPFSARLEASNITPMDDVTEKKNDEKKEDNSGFVNIDSEDEYSFEDVAKSVSQKVIEKEREQKKLEDKNLDDAKAFITSLMSSLNKNVPSSSPISTGPPNVASTQKSSVEKISVISNVPVNPVSSADIEKSLSGITMSVSSLGNILGNIQNLTNKSQVEQQGPKQDKLLPNLNSLTTGPSSAPRNSYNEFDITSQRNFRERTDLNTQETSKGRPIKPYDEFNIGPMTRDAKDELRDFKLQGPLNNRLQGPSIRSQGFSDSSPSSHSPFQDRLSQPDKVPSFSNAQAPPLRGKTIPDRPSPPFPNQYQPRGGSFPNIRPMGNNFESADFGPRSDNFRGRMPDQRTGLTNQRGGMLDQRGGMLDQRGGMLDQKGGMHDQRGGMLDQKGGMLDQRGGLLDQKGGMLDQRGGMLDQKGGMHDRMGGMLDQRGGMHDQRGGMFDHRAGMPEQRGGMPDQRRGMLNQRGGMLDQRGGMLDKRGGMLDQREEMSEQRRRMLDHEEEMFDQRRGIADERNEINNFRGIMKDYRGGANDYNDEHSSFRNDYRADMRGPRGNFQNSDDDIRNNEGDFRGSYGYPRGESQPHKSGNFNNPNRSINFVPPPRFSGSNNQNPYNRW